jgi:hypothetical protein
MTHQLVKVRWKDSVQSQPEWQYIEDLNELEPVEYISVGWVVQESSQSVSLMPNIGLSEPLQGSGLITIPMDAVIEIENLGESK